MKILAPSDATQQALSNGVISPLSSAPGAPVTGQLYFDTTLGHLYIYNGTAWEQASGPQAGGAWLIHVDGTSKQFLPTANTNAARATAMTNALGAATTSGDVVLLGPGTYGYGASNVPAIGAGVTLCGSGIIATIITSSAAGSGGFSIGTGGALRLLTFTDLNGDGVSLTTQTGVLVEDCDFKVGSTGVHVAVSGAGSVDVRRGRFYSSGNYLAGVQCTGTSGLIRAYDCAWLGTNNPTNGELYATAGTIEVYGGTIRSAATTHVNVAGGAVRLNGLDYDPTKVTGTPTLATTGGLAQNFSAYDYTFFGGL